MWVIGRVDLRDQRLEPRLADHEMQMRRPIIVSAGRPHELADRPVDGNRIASGLHAAEMKATGLIGNETYAQIHLGLSGILILVKTFRRGMPDVDFRTRDRIPVDILQGDFYEKSRPWRR